MLGSKSRAVSLGSLDRWTTFVFNWCHSVSFTQTSGRISSGVQCSNNFTFPESSFLFAITMLWKTTLFPFPNDSIWADKLKQMARWRMASSVWASKKSCGLALSLEDGCDLRQESALPMKIVFKDKYCTLDWFSRNLQSTAEILSLFGTLCSEKQHKAFSRHLPCQDLYIITYETSTHTATSRLYGQLQRRFV